MMDDEHADLAELEENLRDIRRVNQLLGGTKTTLRHLPKLIAGVPPTQTITVLDLATGSGDIPRELSRWADRRGVSVKIVASDYSEAILEIARRETAADPRISTIRYDARRVPLPDKQVDVVLCSLSLHHFTPDDAVRVLKEMDRLARRGFILNDLRRGRLGHWAAWGASRVTTKNRLTRHDAPLSVLRAYTPDELDALLRRAGIVTATISKHRWFRMAAVKVETGSHA